jgi:outer membrane protein, heavy metal efflux system
VARSVGLTETSGWLPDLNVGVRAEHDGTAWGLGPALSGQLPLFDRQQGNVISRRAEFQALRERYVADAIGIRATMRATRARAISAQERARHYRETVLPLRENVVSQTLLHYNAMQVGVFQLLQARREQIEAGRSYVATLHEYWKARAALEQLLAGRLAGTLGASAEPVLRVNTQGAAEAGH